MEHFPQNTHRKGCAMKFLQLKKRVPPPWILYIVLQDLYEGGGADFACLSVYVFQNHVKSRKIYMYATPI